MSKPPENKVRRDGVPLPPPQTEGARTLEQIVRDAYWQFIKDRTKHQGVGMSEREAFEKAVREAYAEGCDARRFSA